MPIRKLTCAAVAAALLAAATPANAGSAQPAAAAPLSVDALVRYFDTVVFGSELDPKYAEAVVANSNRAHRWLRRWPNGSSPWSRPIPPNSPV